MRPNANRNHRTSGAPRWRRAVGVLSIAVAVVLGVGANSVAAAPPTEDGPTAAGYGAAWIAAAFDQQIPMENFGSGDWGVTLDGALALAAAQVGATQLDAVWTALIDQREDALAPGGVDAPGRLARAILLAEVLGEDPRAVGSEPGADLVARLEVTRRTSGTDEGLYGTTDPLYDGSFRQGYALAALVVAGVSPDPTAVQWLLAQQCVGADAGAWMAYRADTSVPCAFDADLFVGPDTNATAAAITGLDAVGEGDDAIGAALDWLDTVQEPDGGWAQLSGFGTDPNSTALVIQALLAVDQAGAARFADQDATPLAALLSFQLGCTSPAGDGGAFTFPGSNDAPNGFATVQAVPAAAGVPAVFTPASIAAGVAPLDCTPPTTSTTTSTSTTSTLAPTTAAPTTAAPSTTAAPGAEVAGLTGSAGSTATPTTASASALAVTGTSPAPLVVFGATLVLVGLGVLLMARRRSTFAG
ncbi:MAG: hypothetical protein ACK4V6_02230 [Microthrixaceae bacterium]